MENFQKQCADEFIKAMEYYKEQTKQDLCKLSFIEAVTKLNNFSATRPMIVCLTDCMIAGATMQFRAIESEILKEVKFAYEYKPVK